MFHSLNRVQFAWTYSQRLYFKIRSDGDQLEVGRGRKQEFISSVAEYGFQGFYDYIKIFHLVSLSGYDHNNLILCEAV